MREIETVAEFDAFVAGGTPLDGVVIQDIDLTDRGAVVRARSCSGAAFLGTALDAETLEHVHASGATVFPDVPDLPFRMYRPALYTQEELLDGWDPADPGTSFAVDALDSRIHRWASRTARGRGPVPVLDALAERLHDHAIDDALAEHLTRHADVAAVMGGHSMTRDEPAFRVVAELGRSMARAGWHVATGGGPGAMEAANLGAWLAPYDDVALDVALGLLAVAVDFRDADPYLRAGQSVLAAYPDGAASLAVPTWFYGHEPTNQFASHVAKYFANSLREDGLLAIATRGVVFAPGAAGTLQEVFQDATQNHYDVFGVMSPMVFLDAQFWRTELPAEPLLRRLAGDRPYADLIGTADTADEAMEFLRTAVPITRSRGVETEPEPKPT